MLISNLIFSNEYVYGASILVLRQRANISWSLCGKLHNKEKSPLSLGVAQGPGAGKWELRHQICAGESVISWLFWVPRTVPVWEVVSPAPVPAGCLTTQLSSGAVCPRQHHRPQVRAPSCFTAQGQVQVVTCTCNWLAVAQMCPRPHPWVRLIC